LFKRLIYVSVYYVGSIVVCAGLAMSFAVNDYPRWSAVIPPLVLAACVAGSDQPEFPIKPPIVAAIVIGGLALVASIVGFLIGPPTTW
jgi:hypothetical protein